MRVLRGGEQRVGLVDRIVLGQRRARFHGVGNQTVVAHFQLDHGGGVGQRVFCRGLVTKLEIEIHVVRHIFVDLRSRGGRRQIDDRCQHLVVDLHKLGSVTRLLQRFRDHRDHMVADIADRAIGQDRMRGLVGRRSVAVGHDPAADRAANAVSSDILAGVDGDNALCLRRGVCLDRLDLRMRVVGPDEMDMKLSRARNIGRVAAGAGQKSLVFLAANSGADTVFDASLRHSHSPIICAPA